MTVPAPPDTGTAPTPAPSTLDPTNFDFRADAFHAFFPDWLNNKFTAVLQWIRDRANEIYTTASTADTAAQAAAANAAAAQASALAASAAANAPPWVSGQNYAANFAVYSPITKSTYRRKTAGSGTLDPSEDRANWEPMGTTVVHTDIGPAPNQIPLNQYLGNLAYMQSTAIVINPVALAVPAGVGDMVYQLTNDTTLVIKVKGSDGTVRAATLTLS